MMKKGIKYNKAPHKRCEQPAGVVPVSGTHFPLPSSLKLEINKGAAAFLAPYQQYQ